MAIICLFAWQSTGNNVYEDPFKRSVEAEYSGSDLKKGVDRFVENTKNSMPGFAKVLPVAYVIVSKKKIQFSTSKYSLAPNSTTSYHFENNTGTVNITWSF